MIFLVNRYNTKIQSVPTSPIASRFGLVEREYFEARGEARGSVDVQF
ncbi:MAG: LemA family protein [Aquihabitans sp.]